MLKDAESLELNPVIYEVHSGDEHLSSLIGHCVRNLTFLEGGGCKIYIGEDKDLESLIECVSSLGYEVEKIEHLTHHTGTSSGYELYFDESVADSLRDSGAFVGDIKKEAPTIPRWIKKAESHIQRAYLAALMGSTYAYAYQPKLHPFKGAVVDICCLFIGEDFKNDIYMDFANELKDLLDGLGVPSILVNNKYQGCGVAVVEENRHIYNNFVGFLFKRKLSVIAWLYNQYIEAKTYTLKNRVKEIVRLHEGEKLSYKQVGIKLGMRMPAVKKTILEVKEGKKPSDPSLTMFDTFSRWIDGRWDDQLELLTLDIIEKNTRLNKESVFNVLVDSPDHSFILANGVNNFNSFVSMSGRVYHPFDRALHVRECSFDPYLPIWVAQDFNIDPMSSVILQPQENGEVHAIDEVVIFGSNTEEVCDELEKRYWRYMNNIILYPDPAGRYRQHARGESDLDIFRERGFKKQRYHARHPAIADRVNAVNRMLKAADGSTRLIIDPKCKHLIQSLEQTMYRRGTRDIDKKPGIEHSADALGYCLHYQYPVRKIEVGGVSL